MPPQMQLHTSALQGPSGFVSLVNSGGHCCFRAVLWEDHKALWQRSAQYLSKIQREKATGWKDSLGHNFSIEKP